MIPGQKTWKHLADRLSFRLALVLSFALLPIGIVTMMGSSRLQREAQARSEAALTGETLSAVIPQAALLRRGQGAAAAIAATIGPVIGNLTACSAALHRFVGQSDDNFTFAGFIPRDGHMRCVSKGDAVDYSGNAHLADLRVNPRPIITVNRHGPISGVSVVIFTNPVYDDTGAVVGFLSISMPHSALTQVATEAGSGATGPISFITFDSDGQVLTSSVGLEDAARILPADRTLKDLASGRTAAFDAVSANGQRRTYSVVPLSFNEIFALGSWPDAAQSAFDPLAGASIFMFPALMWVAGLVAAWFAAERLVIRHILALKTAITAFARQNRTMQSIDLSSAPVELREVGDAYRSMTETILHDEAEIEDIVHQKEVLLREVHHRVKNNLQLIASIMNIQMRQAFSPEAKTLMAGVQERIMTLATIHRGLYQTTGLADVRAKELLPDVVGQIMAIATGPGRRFDVTTDCEEIVLTPDQAVPLALLLTEFVTNAIKYAGAAPGPPRIAISFRRDDPGGARLTVRNSISAAPPDPMLAPPGTGSQPNEQTGLGAQLIQAFSMQLGGQTETVRDDGCYQVSIRFTLRALHDAEARNAAPQAADGPA